VLRYIGSASGAWALVFAFAAAVAGLGPPPIVGFLVAYAGVAGATLVAGALAGRSSAGRRGLLPFAGAGIATVALAGYLPADAWGALLHGGALLVAACGVGGLLGREVVDPRHLWPLVIVGASADLWSVTAPEGLTRSLLEGEGPVALAAVVLHLPVFDGESVAPAPILGVGDLLFTAFLLGAAARLGLSPRRSLGGLLVGFGLCLAGLLVLQVPLPALPFIALCFAAAHGAAVRPRRAELAMAVGFALVLAAAGGLFARIGA
jgi:hypothetical protein